MIKRSLNSQLLSTAAPLAVLSKTQAVALMRTVEIDALVSVRKHSKRSASLAALEAATLPPLSFIGGVNAAALPVAIVDQEAIGAVQRKPISKLLGRPCRGGVVGEIPGRSATSAP